MEEQPELSCRRLSFSSNLNAENQWVLGVTCAAFFVFVIAEIVGALASNSLSLLGDAAAMSVDVFTYFCNMWAERIKSKGLALSERKRFILEVYIPSFSVCALLGVTFWIVSDSVSVLENPEDSNSVNLAFLFGFAGFNMLVDLVSTYMFYLKRRQVFIEREVLLKSNTGLGEQVKDEEALLYRNSPARVNVNMASAFTHVGADTLRTFAVFAAAVIATAANVSGNVCDAWAAIVVSITIVVAVVPLIREIYRAANHKPAPLLGSTAGSSSSSSVEPQQQ